MDILLAPFFIHERERHMAKDIDAIKDEMTGSNPKPVIHAKKLLSTGSTIINLQCSGRTVGGIPIGTIVHFVGDSDSGKTFICLGLFSEAARNTAFDNHRLILVNPEHGSMMDREHFFGKRAMKRLEEFFPETLEEFYYLMDDFISDGRPFVLVLDSMDALVPKAFLKKFKKQKSAAKNNKEEAGDFGAAKAKVNSENLRKIRTALPKIESILVMISQTRDNVGGMGFGDQKTVSGGRVLKFYSALQLWSSTRKTLTRTVMGKPRSIGILCQIDVKKNHVTGKKSRGYVPILNDLGIDDVGSCVDFLTAEGYWKTTGQEGAGKVTAPEFCEDRVIREKLIKAIERDEGERELRKLAKGVWDSIEEGCKSERKRRYE